MMRIWRAAVDALSTDRKRWIVIFTVLIAVQALVGNASTALWDQDEAAYAGFAREMVRSGDWVVPHFLWSDVHRKPPLLFWCIAAGFKLFGESEFLVRLPGLLAMGGTYLALLWLARPLVGPRAARLGSMVLGASLLVPNLGKVAVTDSLVLFCDTLVALGLWRYVEKPNWRWLLLFGTGLALGLLAKGPPTLILAVGLLLWVSWRERRHGAGTLIQAWLVVPVAILPFAWWVLLAWRRTDGEFIRWMWNWYVQRRATGGTVFGQFGWPGYHLAVMLVALLPWSALLPVAMVRWRERLADPTLHFLLGWLLFGWIVWEIMPSKLPAYAVGGYPAMALLFGRELDELNPHDGRRRGVTAGIWISGVLAAAFVAALIYGSWRVFGLQTAAFAVLPSLFFVGGLSEGIRGIIRGDSRSASKAFATGSLLCVLLIWIGIIPKAEDRREVGRNVARAIRSYGHPELPVVYGPGLHMPSIPFYVGAKRLEQEGLASESDLQKRFTPCTPGIYVLKSSQLKLTTGANKTTVVRGWNLDNLQEELRLSVQLVTCQP